VPNSILLVTAEQMAQKMILSGKKRPAKKLSVVNKFLETTAIGQRLLFDQATKTVLAKTKGKYPAPLKIIDCVKSGVMRSAAIGYQVEADHFGELVMSDVSARLRELFFATTEMKKEQGVEGVAAKPVNSVAVLGGGLMGGGIAFVSATKAHVPVRIKDINHQGISHALKYSFDILNQKVKRRFMQKSEMQRQLADITGTTDYSGFKQVDLVIEAVFEDLSLKQKMVQDVEEYAQESTIFASNTSSLPINQIAAKAKRPEQVIGLHYFSPVDKMPLAEIIAHDKTSDETISTTVAFAKKQGKTPIVVKDKAGFYVNRILAPYLNEAANLLLAGEPIDKLDKALVNFGFPVGPMQLLDEVGIDIGAKIGPILQAELGERFAPPAAFTKLIEDGRLGKKSSKGFYRYEKASKGGIATKLLNKVTGKSAKAKEVDETVYSLLSVTPKGSLSADEIAQRCVYVMLNEAVRCLDEQIIRNARDGDIGAIFGIGFPPFLGGPYRYLDSIGADKVAAKLTLWAKAYGERFAPCEALLAMAENGTTCYE
jgi:3-hydroxyacyl-CoA dehydrogenase/enoyl-CoA hydratase/3-hydroxybutyryl-CoA epimerase